MTFSLDRDVDDYRVQTAGQYSKNIDFAGTPITDFRNYIQLATNLFCGTARIHEFLREILDKVVTYYDAMTASPRNWQVRRQLSPIGRSILRGQIVAKLRPAKT